MREAKSHQAPKGQADQQGSGHSLDKGRQTPVSLIPVLIIIATVSLFIQPIALAVCLPADVTTGCLYRI